MLTTNYCLISMLCDLFSNTTSSGVWRSSGCKSMQSKQIVSICGIWAGPQPRYGR